MKKSTGIQRFIIIFCLVAFVVTINFILFFQFSAIDEETIRESAILTMGNVLFVSLLLTAIDSLQRYLSTSRPVKKILDTTKRLSNGDFAARVERIPWLSREEFKEIARDINEMAEELNGVETLRLDFINNVSHELKTPLAVIGNFGTLLQNPELTKEEQLEYAKGIEEASKRLAELITNILKLNKLENQQIFAEKKKYNLSEQLAECIIPYEAVWEEKNIDLDLDLGEDVMVTADPELMSLVWNNLLSNAFKFTEHGGKISVGVYRQSQADKEGVGPKGADNKALGECIKVTFTDSGCGMDAETLRHLFDKFYQGDTSHKTAGNGLGMALVKRVIDIMDGEINVTSKLNEGSCFTITLN